MSKARNYKSKDIKKLFALSGNKCNEPTCENSMISSDGENVLGEICHISAASEGGARYDPKMTDDQRRSYDNLILLCPEHHTMIDDKDTSHKYPSTLLIQWKEDHLTRLSDYAVKFSDKLVETACHSEFEKPVNIKGDDNMVIQGDNNSVTKIKRQINLGDHSTYIEKN